MAKRKGLSPGLRKYLFKAKNKSSAATVGGLLGRGGGMMSNMEAKVPISPSSPGKIKSSPTAQMIGTKKARTRRYK